MLFFSHANGGQHSLGDYDKAVAKFRPYDHGRFNHGHLTPCGVHAHSAATDKNGAGDAILLRVGQWVRQAKIGPKRVCRNSFVGRDVAEESRRRVRWVRRWFRASYFTDRRGPYSVHVLALHRWEFLYSVGPMNIPGGTGWPVKPSRHLLKAQLNPIAKWAEGSPRTIPQIKTRSGASAIDLSQGLPFRAAPFRCAPRAEL